MIEYSLSEGYKTALNTWIKNFIVYKDIIRFE